MMVTEEKAPDPLNYCKWKFLYCYAQPNMIPDCSRCRFTAMQKIHEERIAKEFQEYRGTMSSFYRKICEAVQIADLRNTFTLRISYPFLVKALHEEDPRERACFKSVKEET
jgi:hypothetical protein